MCMCMCMCMCMGDLVELVVQSHAHNESERGSRYPRSVVVQVMPLQHARLRQLCDCEQLREQEEELERRLCIVLTVPKKERGEGTVRPLSQRI